MKPDKVCPVLIEPLWNWNRKEAEIKAKKQKSLNRTFVELKPFFNSPVFKSNTGLNRTFVELKHAFPIVDNIRAPCLNRTFVELKPHSALYRCPRVVVLIEPLWNWNFIFRVIAVRASCLNRTFVELKPDARQHCYSDQLAVLIEPLWNWNGGHADCEVPHLPRLNRTFVELKLDSLPHVAP